LIRTFLLTSLASTSIESGVSELKSDIWTARSAITCAVFVTLITGTGLAGCVKGGLDPPPVATAVDEQGSMLPRVAPEGVPNVQALAPAPPVATPADKRGGSTQTGVAPKGAPNGQAQATAPSPRQGIWLDWLIN
jgi:hypothetical protein